MTKTIAVANASSLTSSTTAGEIGVTAQWNPIGRIRPEVLIPILILVTLLGYPTYLLISIALNTGDPSQIPPDTFGLSNFEQLPEYWPLFRNTLTIAFWGTIVATTIATLLAWIIHRTELPFRRAIEVLVIIPYPLGPLVGALAWNVLGAPQMGLINQLYQSWTGLPGPLFNSWSTGGIMLVLALFDAPVAILMIGAAMQRMDPSLEECSTVLGASTLRTARRITLPLMLPAIISAAIFLFVSMISEFAIPAILGAGPRIYVVTTQIYSSFQGFPPNYPLAAVLGILLIAISLIVVWMSSAVLKRNTHAVVGGRSYRPRRLDIGAWKWASLAFALAYILVAVILPVGALLIASVQNSAEIKWSPSAWSLSNYRYVVFELDSTRRAIVNSLMLGVGTGTIGVICAVIVAVAVHRSRGPGRGLLEQLATMPQAFPRMSFGIGILWMLLMVPFPIYGTLWGVMLAYVIVFMPLAYRGMSGVVVQLDISLEEAARVAGARWWRTMRTVTIPLLRSGIVATWALLFMVSVREVGASLLLSGPGNPVLGPAILNFWESGGLPRVSALVLVQAAIILLALFIARSFSREAKPV